MALAITKVICLTILGLAIIFAVLVLSAGRNNNGKE